jgi:hypothetical protein
VKIGLVGPSYQQKSLPFDAQRSINLYPVLDQQGKEVSALYGTPGLSIAAFARRSGMGRGMFTSANGRCFAVVGNFLCEFDGDFQSVLGTLTNATGNVSFDENPTQLAICDSPDLYIYTYDTGDFQQVTDPDIPACGSVTFIDGYFAVNKNSSGQFNICSVNNGLAWSALDFATAESSPDSLLRVYNAVGQLWLLGDRTTEVWTNTGASAFPFERISGAKMSVGILAPHSAMEVDNSLFWLGKDVNGAGIVYRAKGFTPQRISTEAIELIIAQATSPSDIRASVYQKNGHVFYSLNGGGLPTTPFYDVSTGYWHERAHLETNGLLGQHLGQSITYAFSKHYALDYRNGTIYELSDDFYDDDTTQIVRERVYTHISDENRRLKFKQLEIALESGVGYASYTLGDTPPTMMLWISRDGGKTYSNGYTSSMGDLGEYRTRCVFRRLGSGFNWTFKVRCTDSSKMAWIGSYLT